MIAKEMFESWCPWNSCLWNQELADLVVDLVQLVLGGAGLIVLRNDQQAKALTNNINHQYKYINLNINIGIMTGNIKYTLPYYVDIKI